MQERHNSLWFESFVQETHFRGQGKVKVKLSVGITKYHAMRMYLLPKHHIMKII